MTLALACAASRVSAEGCDPADIPLRDLQLERLRDAIEARGCGRGSVFDGPEAPDCAGLLAREQKVIEAKARCVDEDSHRLVPVDPDEDAPSTPNIMRPGAVTPTVPARLGQVFCVRRCDGAFYPLAVDVAADRLGDMDRICRAQCPQAESAAFAGAAGQDVAEATSADGTLYSALPNAFGFRTKLTPDCSCRAPGASWAQTLAEAETLVARHAGDVTVTPALQAKMGRPAETGSTAKTERRAGVRDRSAPVAPNSGLDLTRALRSSVP